MGYGAYMNIENTRPHAIHITVTDVHCMHDKGDQSSNLSLFDNATIQPGTALPGGSGQYIEANDDGNCFFDNSYFTLVIEDADSHVLLGEIGLSESYNAWSLHKNTSIGQVDVPVDNSGEQAGIPVTVRPNPAGPVINRWVLTAQNRCADIWYNQDYTVYGLTPAAGGQAPGFNNIVTVHYQENGTIALQCGGEYNAYASVRDDHNWQVQFQTADRPAWNPDGWCTFPADNEIFQATPTADGYFALFSPHFNRYLTINPNPNPKAGGCNPLIATAGDIGSATRFTATGLDRNSFFDFVQVGKNATGLSLAAISLAGADLSNSNLSLCDFRKVTSLSGCNLGGANLQEAKFGGLSLEGLKVAGTDFTGADFTGCHFGNLVSRTTPPPVLAKAILAGATIPGALSGLNMQGAVLTGANLTDCYMVKSDLSGADFRGATLTRCNLQHAILRGAHFEKLDLATTTFTGADLSGAHLAGVDLTTTTMLTGANLSGADLTGAKLAGVDLTGANLAGTNFTGTDLSTVRFPAPLTRSTDPNHPTVFAHATLPFTVIRLDWSYLDLTSTTITGLPADLTGLVARSARRPAGDFQGCTLDHANFTGATFDGATFSGASLRSASFAGARLIGAVFTRAVLDQAVFTEAALGGVQSSQAANFSYAFIANCDFTQANLYGADFAGATLLSGNKLRTGTNLGETDFSDAYLPNADFTGANLQGARFDGAFMVECVLDHADLSPAQRGAVPASLNAACLQAASLQGTNLAGASLANAAITDERGQINQQYYGEDGKLVPEFPMHYPAGSFPAAASFSKETVCPNASKYETNVDKGLTIAQMMAAPNPPTHWAPRNLRRGTSTGSD